MQELLCREYYVEAAMERAFPGLLPWHFLRADIHDDSVLREEGER